MSLIYQVFAREVLDSRGNPTVEVEVVLESGEIGRAIVPSGASKGEREALELRDNDQRRYRGKGVLKAVDSVNKIIAPKLEGLDVTRQMEIDRLLLELDGTENKSRFGANAIVGVSIACCKAAAESVGLPLYQYIGGVHARQLPVPFMNLINGGAHAENPLDIQEFMIVPHGAESFREALRMGAEVFYALKDVLKSKGLSVGLGDEGGFAPELRSTKEALDTLCEAVEKAGFRLRDEISIALDCAASELFEDGRYRIDGMVFDSAGLLEFYADLLNAYPIVSIEDGFSEKDWEGWRLFTERFGERIQIVGDDIFVTNPSIIKEGISKGVGNSVLIKLNQIGTVTETLEAMEMARGAGYRCIISHRSGETEDPFIADFAVATNAGQIKTGSVSRSERIAKYNELLRIEEELAEMAVFAGKNLFRRRTGG